MTIKHECPDPEDEWHDHGACVDEELLVNAHHAEVMTWDDKVSVIMLLYRKLRYWNSQMAESFMDTQLGDMFDQLREQSDENLQWVMELKRRGKMSHVFAEENEKRREESKWTNSPLSKVIES